MSIAGYPPGLHLPRHLIQNPRQKSTSEGTSLDDPLPSELNQNLLSNYIHYSYYSNEHGLFSIPELTSYEGFYVLKKNAMIRTDQLIDEATGADRSRKMVEIFDELSDTLCKVADMAEFVRLAHPDRKYSDAAEDACLSISGIVEKLNTDRKLFKALQEVVKKGDSMETNAIDKHVSRLFLFDFEQCGIHLPEQQRQRVVYLTDCILQLGQRFMAGAVNPRSVDKNTLPESIRQL